MKKKNLFNLFPKKLASGTTVYYYTTYDEQGKRKQFSTGKTDKQEAYAEVYKRLSEGKILPKSKLIFKEYVKDWFVNGKCPYYSVREAKGRVYSKSSIDNKLGILNKHLTPQFGELRLDHITTQIIELWLQGKKKEGYAVKSLNNYLGILNLILEEAVRTGYIDRNPCKTVIRFAEKKKEKEILTKEEVKILFDKDRIEEIWEDELHFLVNFTAVNTGCRIGEILALTEDKIHESYIEVSNSYCRKYGLKSTKSGAVRQVPISKELHEMITSYFDENPGKFIFSSVSNKFIPVNYATVSQRFKKALETIGISEKERKTRGLTFHSYRHYVNTRLRESGLPDAITREIIGHKSYTMTENYSHLDTSNIKFEKLKIM